MLKKMILTLLLLTTILTTINATGYGTGADGNLYFTTGDKNYGALTTPTDYNVVGNTLYLKLDADYNFTHFYLGSGTVLTTSNLQGVGLFINVQNDANIDGNIYLNDVSLVGNRTKTYSFNGETYSFSGTGAGSQNNSTGFGNGGAGGNTYFSLSSMRSVGNYPAGVGGQGYYYVKDGPNPILYAFEKVGTNGGGAGSGCFSYTCVGDCYCFGNDGGTPYGGNGVSADVIDIDPAEDMSSGGGGGAGGSAGKGGYNLVLYANQISIKGLINLSGTDGQNGGAGGNGYGNSHYGLGGEGGGGGGGGNSGNLYLTYDNSYAKTGVFYLNKGLNGIAGLGGYAYRGTDRWTRNYSGSDGIEGIDGVLYFNGQMDLTPPTTSMTYTIPYGTNTATITLTCTDTQSECQKTTYMIDNNGQWYNYTTPFTLTETGNHTIDYNSTDIAENKETTKQGTIKFRQKIIINKPKIEQTGNTITTPWNLIINETQGQIEGITTDYNVYLSEDDTTGITLLVSTGDLNSTKNTRTYNLVLDGNTCIGCDGEPTTPPYTITPILLIYDSTEDYQTYYIKTEYSYQSNQIAGAKVFIYDSITPNNLITATLTDGEGYLAANLAKKQYMIKVDWENDNTKDSVWGQDTITGYFIITPSPDNLLKTGTIKLIKPETDTQNHENLYLIIPALTKNQDGYAIGTSVCMIWDLRDQTGTGVIIRKYKNQIETPYSTELYNIKYGTDCTTITADMNSLKVTLIEQSGNADTKSTGWINTHLQLDINKPAILTQDTTGPSHDQRSQAFILTIIIIFGAIIIEHILPGRGLMALSLMTIILYIGTLNPLLTWATAISVITIAAQPLILFLKKGGNQP